MPIYEYTCQKCNAHVEVMQKISAKPLTRHSECGGKLEKEWSQTSFQLKGAGWYVTDYTNKKPDAKEKTDSTEKSDAKEKTDAKEKSESKETKTDATVKADSAATGEGTKKKTSTPNPLPLRAVVKRTD
ncbi:MAG: zinc ribbon domain-containing protein [Acidobacteriota bacterium]|nr:zinc ribbon domain-containing protein [Acidobacteriota bacterium]